MKRRSFLALLGGSAVSVSGCLGSSQSDDVLIKAASDSQANPDEPVAYTDLPENEQEIAQQAVEDGLYHKCTELSDAVREFALQFDGTPDEAYLTYQDTTYAMWIRLADQMYAASTSAPEESPSCGLL